MPGRPATPVLRVLLAEDEDQEALALEQVLAAHEDHQFEVERADSAEAALQALAAQPFDVLLLDLTLPDGQGLTGLLRAKEAAPTIPIVVLADEESHGTAVDALGLGAQEYLVKHQDQAVLVRMVLASIERHRVLRDLREARRREYHLATHDNLTGLLNRAAFVERLEEGLARARQHGFEFAVLFLDLDRFKEINDTHGHAAGDAVLCTVSERLRGISRKSDVLARLGGDEFTLLAQEPADPESIGEIATRLIEAVSAPIVLEEETFQLAAAVGIALYPSDGDHADTLLRCADMAMYAAKRDGGACFRFFTDEMTSNVEHRLRPVSALRNALAESRFVLHYQPQIDLDTGEVVSIEALLRWLDRDGRAGNPGPLLEEANRMGLATSVGQWILRRAAQDASARGESGAGRIPIAVNVSALQLNDPRFATIVERTLREAELPARLLEIEIAELETGEIQPRAIEALRAVRRLGVRVALDDFGAATSLRALEALPLDAVKIDPAYVARLPDSPHVESLVRGMIALARGLGCEVIAEGVETDAQLDALRAVGCRRAQGYLLAQPMPASKLALHLHEDDGPWNEILSQSAGGVFTF